MPNAHYISRASGGKGIPENIVSLCMRCHYDFDNYKSDYIKLAIMKYLRTQYPGWDEKDLYYKKGE
jgi:5-methylcytosine-specific restriction endonuclease McrA